jgi:iron(III) transport system substrate-binding protein
MLGIQNTPGLGADYIVKFKSTVEPFILSGGSNVIRDAVVRGQFAIGFSGRGDFFDNLPKGAPLAWVVPKEGLAWTPSSIALINGAPNPNAAKVFMTWLYEVEQMQLWTEQGRPIPHPDVKAPIPEMSLAGVTLMPRIPDEQLDQPNFFFKEMEKVFGIR